MDIDTFICLYLLIVNEEIFYFKLLKKLIINFIKNFHTSRMSESFFLK